MGNKKIICDEWIDWLDKKGAASDLGVYATISAPPDAEISIVDARVKVLRKYGSPSTRVRCLEGGDAYDATPEA
jgi:hypothetical protein